MTRGKRTKNVALKYTLTLKIRPPEKEIALRSIHNKIQLSHFIAKYIISETVKAFNCRGVFVTSADEVPTLVWNEIQTKEIDMCTIQADIILSQLCYGAESNGCGCVKIISGCICFAGVLLATTKL